MSNSTKTAPPSPRVPVAEGAVGLGITRERLIRRIQTGAIEGGRSEQGWYLTRTAFERALAEQPTHPAA